MAKQSPLQEAVDDLREVVLELQRRWDHQREPRGALDHDVRTFGHWMDEALPLLDALWAGDDDRLMAHELFERANDQARVMAHEVYRHAIGLAERMQRAIDAGGRDIRELEHGRLVVETVLDHLTPFISFADHGMRMCALEGRSLDEVVEWINRETSSRTDDRRSEM